jgi:hypothetical protein
MIALQPSKGLQCDDGSSEVAAKPVGEGVVACVPARPRAFASVGRLLAEQHITLQKLLVGGAIGKAGATHFDVVEQTQILDLMCDARSIKLVFSFVLIRFDAYQHVVVVEHCQKKNIVRARLCVTWLTANIMRTTSGKRFVQLIGLHTNLPPQQQNIDVYQAA